MTSKQQDTRQATVDVASLKDAQWNPRATMDDDRLNELVASVADCGVLVPIVVRVVDGMFEVVCGHRRVEACRRLGLTDVQAVIHEDLDDEQAQLVALVENVQREDLTPMDEAIAYRAMIKTGMSIDEVAAKASRSKSAVYQRLKLLDLSQEMQAAVADGRVTLTAAAMIASIPDDKMQREAEKLMFEELEYLQGACATGASVREMLARDFSANLKKAPFDTADATLHDERGPCGECPHRTGNQADLFGGALAEDSPDMCTDPACFHAKASVIARRKLDKHAAKGLVTLDPGEASEIFNRGTDRLKGSKYVKASEKCYDDPEHRAYKALLKGSGVDPVAAADESGKVHLIYPRSAVKKVLADVHGIGVKSPSARVDHKAERRRNDMDRIAVDAIMAAIRDVVMISDDDLSDDLWRLLTVQAVAFRRSNEVEARMIARHAMCEPGQDEFDTFDNFAAGTTSGFARALLVEALLDPVVHQMVQTGDTTEPDVILIERIFGLNLKQIELEAVAAAEAAEAAAAPEPKKAGGKKAKA